MGVNGEALQLCAVYFYYKSRENPYQVLQVTCAASECAMKFKGSYDKIIITIVSSYNYVDVNTDGNKLMIFTVPYFLFVTVLTDHQQQTTCIPYKIIHAGLEIASSKGHA